MLAGIIYIHRASDNRFGGITGRNFSLFCKLCGESALKNVIIATNMWTGDSQDISEAREKELSGTFFKPALDRGAQMVRHYNTTKSAHIIIRRIVDNRLLALQIQRELVDARKNLESTTAGETLAFREQIGRQHRAEVAMLREEMVQVLKANDEEARRVLEEEISARASMTSRLVTYVHVLSTWPLTIADGATGYPHSPPPQRYKSGAIEDVSTLPPPPPVRIACVSETPLPC